MAALVERVGAAIDRFRDGDLDAFAVDQILLQHSRAAKELWRFGKPGDLELTAPMVRDGLAVD